MPQLRACSDSPCKLGVRVQRGRATITSIVNQHLLVTNTFKFRSIVLAVDAILSYTPISRCAHIPCIMSVLRLDVCFNKLARRNLRLPIIA